MKHTKLTTKEVYEQFLVELQTLRNNSVRLEEDTANVTNCFNELKRKVKGDLEGTVEWYRISGQHDLIVNGLRRWQHQLDLYISSLKGTNISVNYFLKESPDNTDG